MYKTSHQIVEKITLTNSWAMVDSRIGPVLSWVKVNPRVCDRNTVKSNPGIKPGWFLWSFSCDSFKREKAWHGSSKANPKLHNLLG